MAERVPCKVVLLEKGFDKELDHRFHLCGMDFVEGNTSTLVMAVLFSLVGVVVGRTVARTAPLL